MKNLSIFSLLAIIAFSCNFSELPEYKDGNQKWALAGYQVDLEGDLEYTSIQDSAYVYTMMPDGTFTKTVGEYELSGTYEESFSDGLTKYRFQYGTQQSLLIHSCSTDFEDYFINSKGQLTGTWDSCDGPKLYFDKE